jgi:hypothetical protein
VSLVAFSSDRTTPVQADYGQYLPEIITRAMWRAKAALAGGIEQQPGGIILHHTATNSDPSVSVETKMRNLQSFSQSPSTLARGHQRLAWTDVPYHFYVDVSGRIAEGRDVRFGGDTNTNYNTAGYIQIVVEGNFEKEKPTPKQLDSLRDLLVWLMLDWNLDEGKVSVHKDHAATLCPGRLFIEVLPKLLADAAARRRSAVGDLCYGDPNAEFSRVYCGNR